MLLMCGLVAKAQKGGLKFGKIDMNDLKMTVYDKDSSAEAVILVDKGISQIKYSDGRFYLIFSRHTRVKILSKDGYDWADVEIPLYHNGTDRESVNNLKAATYNLEGGKMKVSKMDRKATFTEKKNDYWDVKKFTLPDVSEGSIVEYSYIIRSDFWENLWDWEFQTSIPTRQSDYQAEIPEFFVYQRFGQGSHPMTVNDSKRESIMMAGQPFLKNVYHWVADDVPAFREEPYLSSANNYISKINFELARTQFPGAKIQRYMGTWLDMNKTYLKNESFRRAVNGSPFLKDEVAEITASATNDLEKAKAIFNHVRSKMSWNRRVSKTSHGMSRELLKEGEGNSGQINLLLVNMLKKAGLTADPVFISTRSNGFVNQNFALSTQFNSVIALLEIGDGYLLMDATDRTLPFNLLSTRCINGNGWRVSEDKPGWVELKSQGNETMLISAQLKLDPAGQVIGQTNFSYSDYGARDIRTNYVKNQDDFESYLAERHGWEIDSLEMEGMLKLNEPVKLKCSMNTPNNTEVLGNLIYVNPFVAGQIDENPFKLEKREYPVDFVTPLRNSYTMTMEIPEGYVVEELPKSEVVALPNNGGKLSYILRQGDNMISFRYSLLINQTLFTSPEYPYLKQFFAKLVEKQAEQIVLKKVTKP